jgi:hypothetical protein
MEDEDHTRGQMNTEALSLRKYFAIAQKMGEFAGIQTYDERLLVRN